MRKKTDISAVKSISSVLPNQETTKENCSNDSCRVDLPSLPPNYGGMIYELARQTGSDVIAEGINRLVNEDEEYARRGAEKRKNGAYGKNSKETFSHLSPPITPKVGRVPPGNGGLSALVEGMGRNAFLPEDVLICAMIILMLNSNSEDDILLVLVLLMLL